MEPHFDEISIAVLTGQSVATAGTEYGVADWQVVPIVNNYCRRANPAAYRTIQPGRHICDLCLSVLRQNRDRFLPLRPGSAPITKSSSIWCLPGISTITLTGIYEAGVDTIEDLLKIPIETLSRFPKVGPHGLSRTLAALRSCGFVQEIPEMNGLRTSCSRDRLEKS